MMASADKTKNASSQDENAVNREIAALLLNLHASRSNASPAATAAAFQKAEDLSLKSSVDMAMDLSKAHKPSNEHMLVQQQHMQTANKLTAPSATEANYSGAGYSSFYPSLGSMSGLTPSTLATMNSNYLLQNLLLGKMHQLASSSSAPSTTMSSCPPATSSSSLSFPMHPLPASQALALSLPTGSSAALKPPPAVLKSVSINLPSVPTPNNTSLQVTTSSSMSAGGNIPLLCGQIVAQLNGLLFLVHSLNNVHIEASLQTQLTAIYARLQEVVTMVEQAKKQQDDKEQLQPKFEIQKQLEKIKDSKKLEEEKIAKHIQDYQRAMLQQQQHSTDLPSQIAPLKETVTPTSVAHLMQKQTLENGEMLHEVESSTQVINANTNGKRRRGRPPKNSNMDLTYSPPEKKSRHSVDGILDGSNEAAAATTTTHRSVTTTNGSSGKGIRNRVFCGECGGCLKNDDCGRCRYCLDKTKFGGQNRLRQKCLHRRCQMDTHRRRNNVTNSNNAATTNGVSSSTAAPAPATALASPNPVSSVSLVIPVSSSFQEVSSARQSPSPNAIYSGVDLARLAATAAKAEKIGEVQDEDEDLDAPISNGDLEAKKDEADSPNTKVESSSETKKPVTCESKAEPEEMQPRLRRQTRHAQKLQTTEDDTREVEPDADTDQSDGELKSGSNSSSSASGRVQSSRIDRWKAKHEAMLKLAEEGKAKRTRGAKKKVNKEEHKTPEQEDKEEEEDDEDIPEIPDIDPNGLCIDLKAPETSDEPSDNMKLATEPSKPHTRHSAAVQQVLSV